MIVPPRKRSIRTGQLIIITPLAGLYYPPHMGRVQIDHFLNFASEAEIVGLWGLGFLALALFAARAERRHLARDRIDQVGWVPWLGVCLLSAIIGGGLITLAVKGMAAG